jgi:hypothetical protein
MIVELVTFKTPGGWDRARVLEDAKHTIPKWIGCDLEVSGCLIEEIGGQRDQVEKC